MDADVAKALKSLQTDLKAAQDMIDSLKETINDNATALAKVIRRVTALEKAKT
jgi:hypothetical protein